MNSTGKKFVAKVLAGVVFRTVEELVPLNVDESDFVNENWQEYLELADLIVETLEDIQEAIEQRSADVYSAYKYITYIN